MELVFVALSFFLIAALYSSVGFGGGSSYLAILALAGIGYPDLRFIALSCNIVVTLGGAYLFWRAGYIQWRKIWPLVILSIPMAYVGGSYLLEKRLYFILLGVVLITSALALFAQVYLRKPTISDHKITIDNPLFNSICGGGIGFLAGLVGIGGGILLSPFLNLIRWADAKHIAGTTTIFILLNSLAGLLGLMSQVTFETNLLKYVWLFMAVILGGQLGSRWSIYRLSVAKVKLLTAVLTIYIGIHILWKYL